MNIRSKEKFRLTSMIFGILSLVMLFLGLGLPFAAMGLITALLSKDEEPIQGYAAAGFITSLIALIISVLMAISSYYMLYSGAFDSILDQVYEEYEDLYGEPYEDMYNDLYNEYLDDYYINGQHHYGYDSDPYGLYSDDMVAYLDNDCTLIPAYEIGEQV